MPDIDIDFADRNEILGKLKHRVAKLDTGKKHNTGVYVTEIPHNPVDMLSTIDYETAEDRGYFKLDFLNVSIYEKVKDEDRPKELMNKEPIMGTVRNKGLLRSRFHYPLRAIKKLKPAEAKNNWSSHMANSRPCKETFPRLGTDYYRKEVWTNPKTVNTILRKHTQLHTHMQ